MAEHTVRVTSPGVIADKNSKVRTQSISSAFASIDAAYHAKWLLPATAHTYCFVAKNFFYM
ncbi:MAG: hypothetical protein IPO31_13045 [Candidatus Obscuribacter sp.]|nr:hypothetical protein [Candidatus Obscuribacter sp.]